MALCASAALYGSTLSAKGTASAQACESDEALSAERQEEAEEIRRTKIAKQHSIYAPYGMTCDTGKADSCG